MNVMNIKFAKTHPARQSRIDREPGDLRGGPIGCCLPLVSGQPTTHVPVENLGP